MRTGYAPPAPSGLEGSRSSRAVLVRDDQSCIPLTRVLSEGDLVLLLTPVVVPPHISPEQSQDPFQPLSALARHHPWIRHVPYTPQHGITNTHVAFIKMAKLVIFVISGPSRSSQPSQVELSEIARSYGEHRPMIILACCDILQLASLETNFPTIVQLAGYSPDNLTAATDLLFRETVPSMASGPNVQDLLLPTSDWTVDNWNLPSDLPAIHELWCQCLPDCFRLNRFTLQSLLVREGYSEHYVVRDPDTKEVLGFCATYTTFADKDGERLLGSLAAIIVRPSYRRRGVGRSLHDHALKRLRRTRGIFRLQLGSTFPRLLYGVPIDMPSQDWFRRRGWVTDAQAPGAGQEACDWVLKFDDWPAAGFGSTGLTFRPCSFDEFQQVLDLVGRRSAGRDNMGWYDEYAKLADSFNSRDIVVGLEGGVIIATALTYTKNSGSLVAEDLPWASTISDETGGVTCICIADDYSATTHSKDAVMIRLLGACIGVLQEQGMRKLFIDAVKGGDDGFQAIGFKKWARYRDVWREL